MNENLEKIIQLIDKETKGLYTISTSNSGDTYLGTRIKKGFQLVFGVCNSDPMELDFQQYKKYINEELKNNNLCPSFLPFPYADKEILIEVLQGLSENYKADLNINRLIRDVKFYEQRPVFIVITIIAYPIILPIETT